MVDLQQVQLHSPSPGGATIRTCWVDKHVKLGDKITLKNSEEPERLWSVAMVFGGRPPERGWHVGGR
jgi:hypothetical protein